jgi:hypothetical protein
MARIFHPLPHCNATKKCRFSALSRHVAFLAARISLRAVIQRAVIQKDVIRQTPTAQFLAHLFQVS